jgi:hypothetical protein
MKTSSQTGAVLETILRPCMYGAVVVVLAPSIEVVLGRQLDHCPMS